MRTTWPDALQCTATGEQSTRQLDLGTYDVDLDLLDNGGDSLLTERVEFNGIEVTEGGETSLGEVVFDVPAGG